MNSAKKALHAFASAMVELVDSRPIPGSILRGLQEWWLISEMDRDPELV